MKMETPNTVTGGQSLAASLVRHGIRDLFMIPGIQLDWAVDALRQRSNEVRLYIPRHEQTTTYMADGYYRASGKVGAAMVVPGPGALNAGAGLSTAYASNSKVLFIAGQIHSTGLGKGYGLLHEIKDQTGFVRGLTKWNHLVTSSADVAPAFDAAFAQLGSGRPRPVGIEIPHDYLSAKVPEDLGVASRAEAPAPAAPDPVLLDKAASMLNTAKLPVIYVGGGIFASDASGHLRKLAEKIGAPVVMSDNGRGALSDRHPLAMNALAGRAVFQHADVVLVVGSRFVDALTPTASWTAGGVRYIHINIDPDDLGPPRMPEVAIAADAALALPELTERVSRRQALSTADAARVKQWAQGQIDAVQPQAGYVAALREAMADDAIFVNELTQVGYLARIAFPVYGPRSYIGPGYQGTLGYGFPVALGAAVASEGRRVVSITGDGGFGWNLQELATAQRYRLPITLVVFNDGHYGNVRAIQKREFGAEVAVELANPDFELLAKAFGVAYAHVDNPAALGAALKEANANAGPVLIEVTIGVVPSPWHLLRLQPMKGMSGPAAPANPLDEVLR
ncbi:MULTISPECIES: thiamine pyrophosphate-dependent enzyme [unclassified Variovorax]|uniref:thiamine pyrophosphate-dependent enzyme n=1 Tax=unclassified Variovorax TaxID=663243 RepID=UPI00076DDE4D|nr:MULTISPECIES: thiamine pyrophosphate-dependent enzyme [unclassified Variovorax]KWT70662.1 Acetolactate synthase large subunit [Variovorax sp. WDL1]PNG47123.1 Acetolactate synthase isozyme 3 large subunit [Variovorax sp. B2]PNG48226.1 Acetolactate synthase isozyme 3 large subunit [Variovorax sp. B4]VTV14990.1 Acetolactate synthase isozyme 3 large subunit [Variovorax sp. WDL1]